MRTARVLYLTAQALTVQHWNRGQLTEAFAFDATTEGLDGFSRYLSARPDETTLLLADLVEEEFAVEELPHTRGPERRRLHARRAERLFRTTPLRAAVTLGRERNGRRDHRVLFSALTNPEVLRPWIDRLMAAGTPLRAISSIPHLSAALPGRLGLRETELLLASWDDGRLRQTYIRSGKLHLSRLSPPQSDAAGLMEEIARTRRYLHNAGALPAGATLHVYFLGSASLLRDMERVPVPEGVGLLLALPEDVAGAVGVGYRPPVGLSSLYGGLFLRNPVNRYAQPAHRRSDLLQRSRLAVEIGGLIAAIALCVLSADALWKALSEHHRALDLRVQSASMERPPPSDDKNEPLPDGLAPAQLRDRINSAERLARTAMRPEATLGLLGRALRAHPEVTVGRLEWAGTLDPGGRDLPEGVAAPLLTGAVTGSVADNSPELPWYTLLVEGQVIAPGGELRNAVSAFERFLEVLTATRGVLRVDVLSWPVEPGSALKGSAGRASGGDVRLPYSFRLVVRP